jgi:hypothetical protein
LSLKYKKYHTEAVDKNVEACINTIRGLYDLYSKWDIAEAHVQIRRELDLIPEITEKPKRKSGTRKKLEPENIGIQPEV